MLQSTSGQRFPFAARLKQFHLTKDGHIQHSVLKMSSANIHSGHNLSQVVDHDDDSSDRTMEQLCVPSASHQENGNPNAKEQQLVRVADALPDALYGDAGQELEIV